MLVIAIVGILVTVAIPAYSRYIDRANNQKAMGDIGTIALALDRYRTANYDALPATLDAIGMQSRLDPWGNPYYYLNILAGGANKGQMRKDQNLVPLNTDYDLYSSGKDGNTVPPLTAQASQDDIVRANNGSWLGVAKDY
jgi:general secretion pathway protein G